MKCILPIIVLGFSFAFSQSLKLDTIFAEQIDNKDYRYENSIVSYQSSENWMIWSSPQETHLRPDSIISRKYLNTNYKVNSINDLNLTSSWQSQLENNPSIEKRFEFQSGISFYSSAYQFYGIINLFNGDCSSKSAWQQSSRVKLMKVIYNNEPICYVQLIDTWHFQYFSLEKYFRNRYLKRYLKAPYEIKSGDKLIFEILEIYPGEDTNTFAISEFLIEGAKN